MEDIVTTIPQTKTRADDHSQIRTCFIIYVDVGSSSWIVERTYSEFEALHVSLKQSGLPISSISFPSNPLTNRFSDEEIEERKEQLSTYLTSLTLIPEIRDSSQLCRFLNVYANMENIATDEKQEAEESTQLAQVLHFFTARTDQEISVEKGDIVVYYETVEDIWAKCQCRGELGLVPLKYIEFIDEIPDEDTRDVEIGEDELVQDLASAPAPPPAYVPPSMRNKASNNDDIMEQLKMKIIQQQENIGELKRKLDWAKPGSPQHNQLFTELEEARMLHDSLLNNLKMQQAESDGTGKELSIVDQVKLKIANEHSAMKKITSALKTCKPEERRGYQIQLEEHEELLKALYENLESLAMYRLQEEAIQKQHKDNEIIIELRKRVAKQVLEVEKCRSALVNCSGSYEESVKVNQELEENVTLLQALTANLDALSSNSEQPHINETKEEKHKGLSSRMSTLRRKTFYSKIKSPSRERKEKNTTFAPNTANFYRERSATSFFSPIHATERKTCDVDTSKPLPPKPTRADGTVKEMKVPDYDAPKPPDFDAPKPPTSLPTDSKLAPSMVPTKTVHSAPLEEIKKAPDSPSTRRKPAKISHATHKVDDITSNRTRKKKKKAVRVACQADNEKSVMGSKRRYYCILCVCENFEASPPPKPENCRNCKHEFQVHRLHRIRSVRMEKSLFSNCIKAQFSFFL